MTVRLRPSAVSLLLAGTAILTLAASPSLTHAAPRDGAFTVAQAPPAQEKKDDDKDKGRPAKPPARQAPPAAQQQPAKPPAAAQQAPSQQAPAARPAPSAEQQQRREQRREERANQRQQGQPAAQQQQPSQQQTTPPAAQKPAAQPSTAQERRDQRRQQQGQQAPATPQTAPSTAQQPQTAPSTAQPAPTPRELREQRRQERANQGRPGQPQAPAAQQQPQTAPSTAQPPATTQQQQPATTQQPATRQQPATAQQPAAAPAAGAAAVAPVMQPRDAREFMRRDRNDQTPTARIDDIRKQRQEVREGNRTFIREGDRTIVRENNTTIIQHNESNRFVINARNVNTVRRGSDIETVVVRPGGYSIVTVTDVNGRLLRRMRRDQSGRDVVIIDNGFAGPRAVNMFVMLPPPVIRIPRERYIVEMWHAPREQIHEVFLAPPVEPLRERYTLDQVRFSAPLRDRMPRVDLDVTFDTGSWQLALVQIDKLGVVAEGINKALEKNPKEVFMVEGYTDATGAEEDNLSLSDRRAEAVAVALTEQFKVPPENLVTQGYGEQNLKVPTQGPEEANRRVAVRRITPLLDQQQATNATR
jgi:outer membrane protein OmpA-like peptidoglycan-associated protein